MVLNVFNVLPTSSSVGLEGPKTKQGTPLAAAGSNCTANYVFVVASTGRENSRSQQHETVPKDSRGNCSP